MLMAKLIPFNASTLVFAGTFEDGEMAFFAGDYRKAVRLLKSDLNHNNGAAAYYIGLMYGAGNGVEPSLEEATKWFIKSAKQGYSEAQFNLANMFYDGRGVAQSNQKKITHQSTPNNNQISGFVYHPWRCYKIGNGMEQCFNN